MFDPITSPTIQTKEREDENNTRFETAPIETTDWIVRKRNGTCWNRPRRRVVEVPWNDPMTLPGMARGRGGESAANVHCSQVNRPIATLADARLRDKSAWQRAAAAVPTPRQAT